MSDAGHPLPQATPPAPVRARRGCLFYGCLSVTVVGFLFLVLAGFTVYWGKRATERWIRDYTDTTPAIIEKVTLPRDQMEALQRRLNSFKEALDAGQTATELVLTAEEINALLNENKDLSGRLFVRINDDRVTGEVSIPLPDFGPFKLKGRYLNGTATFKVALANGSLDVRIDNAQVKSKPLPLVLTRELKKQNLARDFQSDPQVATNVAKFDSIQIREGKVILRSKGIEARQ